MAAFRRLQLAQGDHFIFSTLESHGPIQRTSAPQSPVDVSAIPDTGDVPAALPSRRFGAVTAQPGCAEAEVAAAGFGRADPIALVAVVAAG